MTSQNLFDITLRIFAGQNKILTSPEDKISNCKMLKFGCLGCNFILVLLAKIKLFNFQKCI